MALLNLVPYNTKINFVGLKIPVYFISALIAFGSILLFAIKGLNYGVDFRGGFLIEIRTQGPANLTELRTQMSGLGLGDVKLQEFGSETDVVIRIERQPGGEKEQALAIKKVRESLGDSVEYRRVDTVGPKVSESLKRNGMMAFGFAMLAMLIYIWFRFEWQFGLCAILALTHDCFGVVGFYSLTGLEFNETAIIAILTTAGYSINDTVVIYDRVRENLRKYKKTKLPEVVNQSINDTLSRTILTSFTTLLALISLYLVGGAVIENFVLPIIVGIMIGTYSSLFLASMLLLNFKIRRGSLDKLDEAEGASAP